MREEERERKRERKREKERERKRGKRQQDRGGVLYFANIAGLINLTSNRFLRNSAGVSGGAFYVHGSVDSVDDDGSRYCLNTPNVSNI